MAGQPRKQKNFNKTIYSRNLKSKSSLRKYYTTHDIATSNESLPSTPKEEVHEENSCQVDLEPLSDLNNSRYNFTRKVRSRKMSC